MPARAAGTRQEDHSPVPQNISRRGRARAWLAAALTIALAVGGSMAGVAAASADSAVPTLGVSKTVGLDPAGESITITGTNYVQGVGAGVYAQIGYIDATWRPSESAAATARSTAYTAWVQGANSGGPYVQWTDNGDGTANFTWTVTVTKAALDAKARAGATLAVFTVGASGQVQAANEQSIAIAFAVPVTTLAVSKTSGLDAAGESITVTGTNYVQGAGAGVYAQIGYIDATWRPSESAAASTRSTAYTAWVQGANTGGPYVQWTDNGDGTANFTWTVTVTKAALDAKARAGATLAVFTVGASGQVQAANEKSVAIAFAGVATSLTLSSPQGATAKEGTNVTLVSAVSPAVAGAITFSRDGADLGTVTVDGTGSASYEYVSAAAGSSPFGARFVASDTAAYLASAAELAFTVTASPVVSGSLTWGVKSAFRSYITGPIASGSITTTGVSTSGGAFVFPQSGSGDFSTETSTGSAAYSGSVRFYGHAGALDITLRNPVVTVNSATTGTLTVTSGSNSVAVATLDLAAGSRSTPNGTLSYSAVPATLTAQGVSVFGGNYTAGTALDPVSFVIGSAGSSSAGTTTFAVFAGAKVPPATPPATTGVTLAEASVLEAGGEVTISADGFRANETDIMVVIYSDPIVLDRTVTADANGHVTWTGHLPDGLTGTHTLTVQGSVNRGIVIEILAVVSTAAAGCPVEDATLTWGFKESFRSYISGTIANGEWSVANGATYVTPSFGWASGTGVYDSDTAKGLLGFTGSVSFTGHSGALNTTIANPQVQFVDDRTAYVLLDISGTTQGGAAVQQKAVRFAELDLSKGDGTKSIPAKLTAEGSEAFGTYKAGDALDAVTLDFVSDNSCAKLSADLAEVKPAAAAAEGGSLGWLWWVVAAVLAAIAVAALVLVRRRRAVS
ncbi:MAG: hypothetical protein JWO10_303 [Microbacteriaceae bacterium]|nr:hypothetical protein [Microbacteriaceae bacterium]